MKRAGLSFVRFGGAIGLARDCRAGEGECNVLLEALLEASWRLRFLFFFSLCLLEEGRDGCVADVVAAAAAASVGAGAAAAPPGNRGVILRQSALLVFVECFGPSEFLV